MHMHKHKVMFPSTVISYKKGLQTPGDIIADREETAQFP